MNVRSALLTVMALLALFVVPAAAQQSLGDLVSQGGYDWLIGKWLATTDEGGQLRFEHKWALDRNTMLVDFQMGGFRLQGMIVFIPSREEVIQISADNQGGTWKGTWRDEYGDAVHRTEQTRPDGQTWKAEIVYTRVDADTMKTTMYAVDSDGYRAAEAMGTMTYKRQPADAPAVSASSASAGSTSMRGEKRTESSRSTSDDRRRRIWPTSSSGSRRSPGSGPPAAARLLAAHVPTV